MNQEERLLFREFKKEIWLYLDKDLPSERLLYWDEKIQTNDLLKNYLADYLEIEKNYNPIAIKLDKNKYNLMVEKAVKKQTIIQKAKEFMMTVVDIEHEFVFGKIAFASFLILATIIISLVSDRPNSVSKITETVNSEILEWDATYLENQFDKVENLLKLAKDDSYKKYFKYGTTTSKVDKNISFIGQNINELKKDIQSKNL